MAVTVVTLNGTTLPQASGFDIRTEYLAGVTTLANGDIRRDLVDSNRKRRFVLSWVHQNKTNRDAIETAYTAAVAGAVNLVTPDGDTVSVTAPPQPGIQASGYSTGAAMYYRISLELWEV